MQQRPDGTADRALAAALAALPDAQARQRHAVLHDGLVRLFSLRGCDAPEQLAGEALRRLQDTLAKGTLGGSDLAAYAHGVARRIADEHPGTPPRPGAAEAARHAEDPAPLRARLETCLDELAPADRDLICQFYDEARRSRGPGAAPRPARPGAEQALWRVRRRLEACVAGAAAASPAPRRAAAGPARPAKERQSLVRYVLGTAEAAERDRVEQLLLDSQELQEQVDQVEAELLDGYVLRALDTGAHHRVAVQSHAIPAVAGRLTFTRELVAACAARRTRRAWVPWAVAGLALLLAVSLAWCR